MLLLLDLPLQFGIHTGIVDSLTVGSFFDDTGSVVHHLHHTRCEVGVPSLFDCFHCLDRRLKLAVCRFFQVMKKLSSPVK